MLKLSFTACIRCQNTPLCCTPYQAANSLKGLRVPQIAPRLPTAMRYQAQVFLRVTTRPACALVFAVASPLTASSEGLRQTELFPTYIPASAVAAAETGLAWRKEYPDSSRQ